MPLQRHSAGKSISLGLLTAAHGPRGVLRRVLFDAAVPRAPMAPRCGAFAALLAAAALVAPASCAPRLALDRSAGRPAAERTATITLGDYRVEDYDDDEESLEGEGPATTIAYEVANATVVDPQAPAYVGERTSTAGAYTLTAALEDVNAVLSGGVGVQLTMGATPAATASLDIVAADADGREAAVAAGSGVGVVGRFRAPVAAPPRCRVPPAAAAGGEAVSLVLRSPTGALSTPCPSATATRRRGVVRAGAAAASGALRDRRASRNHAADAADAWTCLFVGDVLEDGAAAPRRPRTSSTASSSPRARRSRAARAASVALAANGADFGAAAPATAGASASVGVYVSPGVVHCAVPAEIYAGGASLAVANNGVDFSDALPLVYGARVAIAAAPGRAPKSGGTVVVVAGTFAANATRCAFGAATVDADVAGDVLTCRAPPAGPLDFGAGVASAPLRVVDAATGASSASVAFYYYDDGDRAAAAAPAALPLGAAATVAVAFDPPLGAALCAGSYCVLGGAATPLACDDVGGRAATCALAAPEAAGAATVRVVHDADGVDPGVAAFVVEWYAPVAHLEIRPDRGPASGGSAVVLNVAAADRCRFGDAVVLRPTARARTRRRRQRRAGGGRAVAVAVSVDGGHSYGRAAASFYYDASAASLAAIAPTAGPAAGGETVALTGLGFARSPGLACLFGGVAVAATFRSPTEVTCAAPPLAPGAHCVQLAINGEDADTGCASFHAFAELEVLAAAPARAVAGVETAFVVETAHAPRGRDLACVFGGDSAPAVWVDNARVACRFALAGPAELRVAVDGDVSATFAEIDALEHLGDVAAEPDAGPTTGGTIVRFAGAANATHETASCVFAGKAVAATLIDGAYECAAPPSNAGLETVALVASEDGLELASPASFAYYDPPSVRAVSPSLVEAGTVVLVEGNFAGAGDAFCGFGDAAVEAVATDDALSCVVPPSSTYDVLRPVAVSLNGRDWHDGGFGVYYVRAVPAALNASDRSQARATVARLEAAETAAPPSVDAVAPASGGAGAVVALHGANFARGASCSFGDVVVAATFVSSAEVTCVAPAGASSVAVRASNDGAAFSWSGPRFLYRPPLALESFAPLLGSERGGTVLTLVGSGFHRRDALRCDIGGRLTPATWLGATTVSCAVPLDLAPGTSTSLAVGGAARAVAATTYRVHAAESVASVSPVAGSALGGAEVTLRGAFPDADSLACRFGTALAAATRKSPTELTCVAPPAAGPGGVLLAVSTNGVDFHEAVAWTYTEAVVAESLAPRAGPAGTRVEVAGRGFVGAADAACDFGGVEARATILSSTALACDAPADSKTGAVDVAVVLNGTRYGRGLRFAVRAPMTLLSVAPATFPETGGAFASASGAGFSRDANLACRFGGGLQTPASRLSDGLVRCEVPPATPGAARFSVVDAGGGEVLALLSAPLPDGGDLFCKFGAAARVAAVAVDAVSIACRAPPAAAAGAVDVKIGVGGVTHASTTFTYLGDAAVAALAPSSGPAAGGTVVRVAGADFEDSPTLACRFGSVRAAATFVSPTEISCVAPASASRSRVAVTVTTNGVDFGSSSAFFTFFPSPEIAALTPAFASERGGTWIAVAGAHFEGDAVGCDLDGAALRSVRESPSLLRGVDFDDDGPEFLYAAAATVQTFEPRSGSAGTKVTLVVADLPGSAAASCRFGTTVVAAARAGATLTCEAPERALGPASLAVSTNGVDWTTADGAFHYASPIKASAIKPPFVYERGGVVVVEGSGFVKSDALACRLGDGAPRKATWLQDSVLVCPVAPAPPGRKTLAVSNDGASFHRAGAVDVVPTPSVSSASPLQGPVSGGTTVSLVVEGLVDPPPAALACHFGSSVVRAALKDGKVECDALPASAPGVVALRVGYGGYAADDGDAVAFEYVPAAAISRVFPPRGPLTGGTALVVVGDAFDEDLDGAKLACRFRSLAGSAEARDVAAAIVNATAVSCESPFLERGQAALSIAAVDAAGATAWESNALGYYFYEPLRVDGAAPRLGPETGGTVVTVRGARFGDLDLTCRVGDTIQAAARSRTPSRPAWRRRASPARRYRGAEPSARGRITCETPDLSAIVVGASGVAEVRVSVSLNGGVDLSPTTAPFYASLERPKPSSIAPPVSALAGGTMLVIRGSNLAAPDAATGAPLTSCRFDGRTVVRVVPAVLYYVPLPRLTGLSHGSVFEQGGIDVAVFGQNFAPTAQLSCRFGASKVVAAVFVSEARVTCAAPAGLPNSKVCVEVTINGDDYTSDCAASLAYTARPRVADASPKSSTALLDGVDRPAYVLDDGAVRCDAPRAPPAGAAGAVAASVGDGGARRRVEALTFYYASPLSISKLGPSRGPARGGTAVVITGDGFDDTARCVFAFADGSEVFAARKATSPTELVCESPPAGGAAYAVVDVASRAPEDGAPELRTDGGLLFGYRAPPSIDALAPASGVADGGTEVIVLGRGWTASDVVTCRFGAAAPVAGFHIKRGAVVCEAPPNKGGAKVALALALNGVDYEGAGAVTYSYANRPTVASLAPKRGPRGRGTLVTIRGSGFVGDGGVTVCRFGDAPKSRALEATATAVTCVAPPATAAGAGSARVSFNDGADWSDPLCDPSAAAFDYVDDVDVASVAPQSLPAETPTLLYLETSGPVARCSVGVAVGHGGACLIACRARPGPVPVEVSVDGQTFHDAGHAVLCVAAPKDVDVAPASGGVAGGTVVTVHGVGPAPASRAGSAMPSCPRRASRRRRRGRDLRRAGARAGVVALAVAADADANAWSDAAPFAYYGPEAVDAAVPAVVAVDGTALDITVKLREALPASAAAPRCVCSVAGEPARRAAAPDGLAVACALPAAFRGAPGTVTVRLAANGVDASASFAEVEVVARPEVLSPRRRVPAAGGELAVYGRGFLDVDALACVFAWDSSSERVPATFVSAGEARCFPPSVDAPVRDVEISNGAAAESRDEALLHFCAAPKTSAPGAVPLALLLHGVDVGLNRETFAYRDAPRVYAVTPAAGPPNGGTRVLLEGDGLAPRDDYAVATRCAFGAADATAAAAGADAVARAAPTLNEATTWAPRDGDEAVSVSVRVSVNGEAFLDVRSFTYESRAPARSDCGVEAAAPLLGGGGTVLTLTGPLFATSAGPFLCRLGDGVAYARSVGAGVACDAPANAPGPLPLEVAAGGGAFCATGLVFEYAASPAVRAVAPAARVRSGDVLKLAGSGFRSTADLRCRVGAAAPSPALWRSSTLVECAVPEGLGEGSHEVGVANNGVDFGDAAAVFVRGDDVTLSFSPALGPAAGGTVVTVVGLDRLRRGDEPLLCVVDGRATMISPEGACRVSPSALGARDAKAFVAYSFAASLPADGAALVADPAKWYNVAADAGVFTYHAPLAAESAEPASGPRAAHARWRLAPSAPTAADVEARGGALPLRDAAPTLAVVVGDRSLDCVAPAGGEGVAPLALTSNGVDFDDVVAGFTYYAPPALASAAPLTLPRGRRHAFGGREVLLRGRGFAHFAGERFSAHFGDVAVAATVVDDATLSCIAPSRTVSETVVVRAALGAPGEEVFLPSEDPTFDFHANPVVTAIHPAAGTARGGNALVVVGSGFADGGSLEGALAVTGVAPGAVDAVGGTVVTVSGFGFFPTRPSVLSCKFGTVAVPATFLNETAAACRSPRDLRAGSTIPVAVSLDGEAWVGSAASSVRVRAAPRMTGVVPSFGPEAGGTTAIFTVAADGGLRTDEPVYIRVGHAAVVGAVLNATAVAAAMPSKKDARILGDAATLAVAILGDAPGALPAAGRDAQILGGGGVAFFTYYASPEAHVVAPRSAPAFGATLATVYGAHFLDAPTLTCRWGDLGTSPATFVAAGELRCATVSAANVSSARLTVSNNGVDFGDVGAVARFWPEPSLDAVVPSAGPDSGETGVVLRGAGVGDLARAAGDLVRVFGVARRPATWLRGEGDDDAVRCASPPASEAISSKLTAAGGGAVPLRLAPTPTRPNPSPSPTRRRWSTR
ncbi:hypothetical protein JL721_583 [Aureococcus anophagefferens]|nr:hypothetical protein JL721_583 [Aureococcus anophagefferens]